MRLTVEPGDPPMDATTPALSVEDLYKSFGDVDVIKGVSVTARKGDVISILGASGIGQEHFPQMHQSPGGRRARARSLSQARRSA